MSVLGSSLRRKRDWVVFCGRLGALSTQSVSELRSHFPGVYYVVELLLKVLDPEHFTICEI